MLPLATILYLRCIFKREGMETLPYRMTDRGRLLSGVSAMLFDRIYICIILFAVLRTKAESCSTKIIVISLFFISSSICIREKISI